MAMVALSDGSTILYNPIAPTEQTLREIKDSFGSPGAFVVVICFVVDMQTKRRSMLKMQDTLSHRVFSPFGRVEQGLPSPLPLGSLHCRRQRGAACRLAIGMEVAAGQDPSTRAAFLM